MDGPVTPWAAQYSTVPVLRLEEGGTIKYLPQLDEVDSKVIDPPHTNSITGQNSATCDPPHYIAVTS